MSFLGSLFANVDLKLVYGAFIQFLYFLRENLLLSQRGGKALPVHEATVFLVPCFRT